MPVGCNLYFSSDDINKARASLKKGRDYYMEYEILPNGMEALKSKATLFISILKDPNHLNFKLVKDWLNDQIAGTETVKQEYRERMPKAMALVLEQTPDALGLAVRVPKYRGKRSNAVYDNLKHKTRGDAFAYEILGTAALIERKWLSKDGEATLQIDPKDRVDFGVKFQASYDGASSELKDQPRRLTVEADTYIQRHEKIIGIDFKYSKNGEYSSYSIDQLKGIKNAILTGECTEFNFVTNGRFSEGFTKAVDQINQDLDKTHSRLMETCDEEHENFRKIRLFEKVGFSGG